MTQEVTEYLDLWQIIMILESKVNLIMQRFLLEHQLYLLPGTILLFL